MVRIGCTPGGSLDDSKFNEPMPWIGAYVAAASAVCALAMAADAAHGIRYRKLWFPSKFFALNATTLTLIGIAVKLSVDLNTSMPRAHDQLAKLSSTAFLCTAMANSMPSLGSTDTNELMMNVVALGILVITVLVNVGIQLATGVIYLFWAEHIVIMILMVVLLGITVSSSLAIPATKVYFELKYAKKSELPKKECGGNLKNDLTKYWMMAHTCNPQFVMGRLATCTASGAYCLLSAVTLAVAVLRSYFMPWCFTFCKGGSDYQWSTVLVLATQAAAVAVGTVGPASRWFFAIKFRCPKRKNKSSEAGFSPTPAFSVENYWVQTLNQLKECPLDIRICSGHGKKLAHHVKNKTLNLCILVQKTIVVSTKFVQLVSILLVSRLIAALSFCKKLVSLFRSHRNCDSTESNPKLDLSQYVMHLEGEESLIHVMMECDRDTTGHFLRMGRKKQPKHLLHIMERFKPSHGFEGVFSFDSKSIPPLDSTAEPPKSWALAVVTLTSIAVATSTNSDFNSLRELMKCVNEGLKYIRVIEKSLDVKQTSTNIRRAAEIVWVGIDLHYRWLDVDLRGTGFQEKGPKQVISELSKIAEQKFVQSRKEDPIGCLTYDPARWPVKVLAANAMYRACETLLLTNGETSGEWGKSIIERLSGMIVDLIGACLTNLERAIIVKCHESSIEKREESVRHAILLLGKTERIMEIVGCRQVPSCDPEKMACINEWREIREENDRLGCGYTPTSSDISASSDLYLNID